MEENDILCLHSFFPMLKQEGGFQGNKSWSKNKLTAIALIKGNFKFTCPFYAVRQVSFELHLPYPCWSYWVHILLYLGRIRKILHSPYCIYFNRSKFNRYSEFNFMLLFIFLSKHKALYKQFSCIHFLNKELKILHQ